MIETEAPVAEKQRVRWSRVALFYGLAFGWVCLLAAGLWATGNRNLAAGQGISLVTVVRAVAYMPAPLVAALVVERLDRRTPLIRDTFRHIGRTLPTLVAVAVPVVAALMAGMVGVSWLLGNTLLLLPGMDADQVAGVSAGIPSLWPLLGITFVSALVAGFTINAVFAFGEEYGWRGWLADELRPLGPFRANVITGVLWGVWHAPLILMGLNYGGYARLGTAFMVAFCVPMSFLLWRAREVTGSVLAPAVLHGSVNAFAGVFLVVIVDPIPVIAAPAGLVGALVVAVVAALFWVSTRKWAGRVR
ncbi:MAG: CPBP family intramembrane metalloprotease [Actinobacteria bacterium]|nr:CPBP family intramembrane metalloprotease [Actinomycetota bacterium]